MEPGGRAGRDLQSVEGDRPKHAVEMGGKERVEDLPEPVIMERGALEAGLKQGEPPTFLQTCPHLIAPISAERNSATIWDETVQFLPRKSDDLRLQG
jgi:hypothetical protein